MEQAAEIMSIILQVLVIVILFFISIILYRVFAIVGAVKKIIKRIETLTDVKGWIDLFSKFKRKNKK